MINGSTGGHHCLGLLKAARAKRASAFAVRRAEPDCPEEKVAKGANAESRSLIRVPSPFHLCRGHRLTTGKERTHETSCRAKGGCCPFGDECRRGAVGLLRVAKKTDETAWFLRFLSVVTPLYRIRGVFVDDKATLRKGLCPRVASLPLSSPRLPSLRSLSPVCLSDAPHRVFSLD